MKFNRGEAGMGLGLAAALAICCGGKLLILGLPTLALLSGGALVVGAAAVVALAAAGVLVWRRRSSGCSAAACAPLSAAETRAHQGDNGRPEIAVGGERPLVAAKVPEPREARSVPRGDRDASTARR